MNLTRKFLSSLGVSDEAAESIITAHTETVSRLHQELDAAKEAAGKLDAVQKELDEAKSAGKKYESFELKYNAKAEEFDALKKEFEGYKNSIVAKETRAAKEAAYKALLKAAGISEKRIDSILRISPVDEVELTDDGKIKDEKDRSAKIKQEWADFIVKETVQGAQTATPPEQGGGTPARNSRAAELARKYHDNIYGKSKKEEA